MAVPKGNPGDPRADCPELAGGGPDAVAVLIRGLDEQNRSNRLQALEALGHFGTDAAAAVPKLQSLQTDRDASIRDAAMKSLAKLGVQSQPDAGAHPGRPRP